jgi:hypothetical protein
MWSGVKQVMGSTVVVANVVVQINFSIMPLAISPLKARPE